MTSVTFVRWSLHLVMITEYELWSHPLLDDDICSALLVYLFLRTTSSSLGKPCPSQAHEDDAHLSKWIMAYGMLLHDLDDECHPSYGLALPISSSGYAVASNLEGETSWMS